MIRFILAIGLLLPLKGLSQAYIDKTKKQTLVMLSKYDAGAGFQQPVIEQTDSTIRMIVKNSNNEETSFTYRFDKNGRCRSELIKASCDSCFKKYLQNALDQKKYYWQKINENQYISSYAKNRMIELPPEYNDFSFIILRTGWTRKLYALLTDK